MKLGHGVFFVILDLGSLGPHSISLYICTAAKWINHVININFWVKCPLKRTKTLHLWGLVCQTLHWIMKSGDKILSFTSPLWKTASLSLYPSAAIGSKMDVNGAKAGQKPRGSRHHLDIHQRLWAQTRWNTLIWAVRLFEMKTKRPLRAFWHKMTVTVITVEILFSWGMF